MDPRYQIGDLLTSLRDTLFLDRYLSKTRTTPSIEHVRLAPEWKPSTKNKISPFLPDYHSEENQCKVRCAS
jgi:hypothetical protein